MDDTWLSMVRVAREIGDVSSLFPPGIKTLMELPYPHHTAIVAGLTFVSFDELPEDEKPPKHIWLDEEKMKAHWAEVKRLRKAKAEGHGDQAAMTKNPLMKRLRITSG